MVRLITSFALLASAVATFATYAPGPTASDFLVIVKRSQEFNATVHDVPKAGASPAQTTAILKSTEALGAALEVGAVDLTPSPATVADEDAKNLLNGAKDITANLIDGLITLATEKAAILITAGATTPNVTLEDVVEFDLKKLHASALDFDNALIAAVPSAYKANATAMKASTEVAFTKALAAYAN